MRISKGLQQAYFAQDFTFEVLMALQKSLCGKDGLRAPTREEAQSISLLIKAWVDAQERVRIHRGKPLPGSFRPESKPKAAAASNRPNPILSLPTFPKQDNAAG
jgi:hypothetical protein